MTLRDPTRGCAGRAGAHYQPETDGSGVVLLHYDLDGDLDFFYVDGGIFPGYEGETPCSRLFRNDGDRQFVETIGRAGIEVAACGMGATAGDIDVDGDLDRDMVITNSNDFAEVWENVSNQPGAWLQVDLSGSGANTDAIGTRVELESSGEKQTAEALTASSYLSPSATTLHFGLGHEPSSASLLVRWPAGSSARYLDLPTDSRLRLYERTPSTSTR